MRVLLVSPLPPPMGGIATLTQRMLNSFSLEDVDVACINVAHKVNKNDKNITNYTIFDALRILFKTVYSVLIKCKKNECDLIHINSSCGGGTLRDYIIETIANIYNVPVVIQYHCNIELSVNNNKIAKYFHLKCFSKADKIIVLNESCKKFIQNKGFDAIIVPNGISKKLIVSSHDINKELKKIVFTGRVSKEKGCLELYECAKKNKNIEFYLAGLIEEELKEKFMLLKNVNLLGPLPHNDVIDLLDSSDIFVFPSYSEGFSISLLEAMARGLPCITTNVGANIDMLENKGGIIIASHNSNELNDAIEAIRDMSIRKSMSLWNIQKVSNCYTEEKMFEMLHSIYLEVLN